jgi:predicted ester cyclase
MDVWTSDFVVHAGAGLPQIKDGETMKRIIGTFWTTIPDLHVSVDDILAEGDRVAVRVTSRGTHTGHFRSVAPTGNKVEFPGYAIFRMRDGKAAEEWILDDLLTFLRQIGVVPAAAAI